ncbi:peptidase M23 [Kitasatospora sp. NPDC088783]|uniref:peptidase M23 n=1 Tax=Kitasatospora sp. NPDC088783 TaxID=3364077 RepID=UPI003800A515
MSVERDLGRAAVQAATAGKKAVALKYGIVVAVVFFVLLLLLGLFAPTDSASAASCEDSGAGTGSASTGSTPASGPTHDQQLQNAKAIDAVAVRLGLPGRATLIALMTAMQESTLLNIDHGDRDSVGLFQQRPSMAWGTVTDIMRPEYAAESFFMGRGSNSGLTDIPGWQTMPLGDAAQKVQKSAYPTLYAGHETEMRTLAREAGIDLERTGTASSAAPAGGTSAGAPVASGNTCQPTGPDYQGTSGGAFHDGAQTWTLNNPRTVEQAIAWAKENTGSGSTANWRRRCLAWSATVYGWNYSGIDWAIHQYQAVPTDMRHPGDRTPPPGALMFWDTGSEEKHIAVYVGDGKVASTDILRPGYADIVPAELLETKWRATYIGWTVPFFPEGG